MLRCQGLYPVQFLYPAHSTNFWDNYISPSQTDIIVNGVDSLLLWPALCR